MLDFGDYQRVSKGKRIICLALLGDFRLVLANDERFFQNSLYFSPHGYQCLWWPLISFRGIKNYEIPPAHGF